MRKMGWLILIVNLISMLITGCGAGTPGPSQPSDGDSLYLYLRWGAALGSYGGTWLFLNAVGVPCVLHGHPTAELLEASGAVLLRSAPNPAPVPPPVTLQPGEVAAATVLWSNWCGPQEGPYYIRIVLPRGTGSLTTPVPGAAGCTGPPEAGSSLVIEDFTLVGSS